MQRGDSLPGATGLPATALAGAFAEPDKAYVCTGVCGGDISLKIGGGPGGTGKPGLCKQGAGERGVPSYAATGSAIVLDMENAGGPGTAGSRTAGGAVTEPDSEYDGVPAEPVMG